MQTGESTLYEVLGLIPTATEAEVRSAYRRLALLMHPDVGGTATLFCQVEEAYATLSDPARRAAYDESLRFRPPWAPDWTPPDPTERGEPIRDPASGWDQRFAATSREWRSGPAADAKPRPSPAPAPARPARSILVELAGRHPWALLVIGGCATVAVIPGLGAWLLLFGLIAALGAHRLRHGPLSSRTGGTTRSGLALLGAEIVAGWSSLLKVALAIVGALVLTVLTERGSSRRRR